MNSGSDSNRVVIEKINEAFALGNTDVLSRYLSNESRWQIISISTISGKTNILRALGKEELASLPEITVKHVITEGDTVVVESSGVAMRRSGQPYTASYRDVYKLEEGMITEFTTYVIESD